MKQLLYRSEASLCTSDHSPVCAHFELDVRVPWVERGLVLGRLTLVLSRLSAHGLTPTDANGLADPYLQASIHPLRGSPPDLRSISTGPPVTGLQVHPEFGHASPIASSCKPKTLAPEWRGEELVRRKRARTLD